MAANEHSLLQHLLQRNVGKLGTNVAAKSGRVHRWTVWSQTSGLAKVNLNLLEKTNSRTRTKLPPFLRYPGGKKRFTHLLSNFVPENLTGYHIEPFAGSAALFFETNPQKAILNDNNPELIHLYHCLQKNPDLVWKELQKFGSSREDYYEIRNSTAKTPFHRAAKTLYLNRTCFGGMWRYQEGAFTTGYGGPNRLRSITKAGLRSVGEKLQFAKITHGDYKEVIQKATASDFVFLDPPYTPGEKTPAKGLYAPFPFDEYQNMAEALQECPCPWIMTTSSHPDIQKLFTWAETRTMPKGVARGRVGASSDGKGEILVMAPDKNWTTKL